MNDENTRTPSMDPHLATPEEGASAEVAAKELFTHGLLQAHFRESERDTERRVGRLLEAIDAEDRARRAAHDPARSMSFAAHASKTSGWRSLRFATGLAAAMTLIAVLAIEFTPTNTALAAVQASVEASKSAGDRRYTVKVQPQKDKGQELTKIATLDVRDPEHVVIKAKTPQGHRVTVGRSPEGVWAIRPDGTIDRYAPKSAMPRWVNFGSNTIVLESVDDLMKQLAKDYTLTRGEAEALPGTSGTKLDRITAKVKKDHVGPEPERVEMWMDSASRVVKRLELHWPEFAARAEDAPDAGERKGLPEGAGGPPWRRRGPGGPGGPGGRPGEPRDGDGKGGGDRGARPPMDGPRPDDGRPREGEGGDAPHANPPPTHNDMDQSLTPRDADQPAQVEGDRPRHPDEGMEPRRGAEDRPGPRGPGPDRRGEMDPARRPMRDGEMRGPHGPMGPGGPMDGPRGPMPGPREIGREGSHGPEGGRGPMGGPMGGPPQFLGERPDFRRRGPGGPPPPPRVMVFELEEGEVFAEGWFEPEAHGEK